MAVTIDGVNRLFIMGLGDSASPINVIDYFYEPWKDFFKTNGSQYGIALFSEGGSPVSEAQGLDQGAYIRINNADGWRIRPSEEDADYSFIGNLLSNDETNPIFTATLGGYTVLINGLQPITQIVNVDSGGGGCSMSKLIASNIVA